MLQPYDWDQPTNYYRLTQKSFAVVIAKLDNIDYSRRLAKLNAEEFANKVANSRAAKEASSDSYSSERPVPAKATSLHADIARLMVVRNPPPSRHFGSGIPSQRAEPRPLLATTTTEVVSATSIAAASLRRIRLFVLVALLVVAAIWTKRRADPVEVG